MATIDSIMRLMYLEDQERRRDKADEVRSVNAALTQFGRIANASATTAGTLSFLSSYPTLEHSCHFLN